jgi:hypothetical protein
MSWRDRATLDWTWTFALRPMQDEQRTRFHFRSRWVTDPWWFTPHREDRRDASGAIDPNRSLLGGDHEGGTWCPRLFPDGDHQTRLGRWRVDWPLTPATAFWILLSDPGAFIMERRMLLGIRERAERAAATAYDDGHPHPATPPRRSTPTS